MENCEKMCVSRGTCCIYKGHTGTEKYIVVIDSTLEILLEFVQASLYGISEPIGVELKV
jgi:hypothetical protein